MRRFIWGGGAVIAAMLLTGCGGGAPEPAPSSSPVDEPSSTPSEAPSEGPRVLTIPGSCDELVSIDDIHSIFGPAFVPIPYERGTGDPELDAFVDRGGISCIWGIPDSDAGAFALSAAPRATADDATQIAAWVAEGLSECPAFLDACFYEGIEDQVGTYHRAHVLVEGFELRAFATTTALDPLLQGIRAATDSMGHL